MITAEDEAKAKWWEELSQAERNRLIKEANDARLWVGNCQCCGYRIEAYGRDWPIRCPVCGFG